MCYRVRGGEIEFLLVKTGKGRWIFPKGSVEPGLTHAQAAALEAFEEAGVHGRMEEASFARYIRRRRRESRNAIGRSSEKESAVNAHLCEVLRLVPPQELGRNPTWFSPERRSVACRSTARLTSGTNWLAWLTALFPASGALASKMLRRYALPCLASLVWRVVVCRKCNSSISAEFGKPPAKPNPRGSAEEPLQEK